MTIADKLVLQRQRHLKWRALDPLELALMMLCGCCCSASRTVMFDIVTRTIGQPWLWLQEVTSTFFIYAIFIGAAVATRRNDHLYLTAISESLHGTPRLVVEILIRLVVLGVALLPDLVRLHQFPARLRQLPHAVDDADRLALRVDPVSGVLIALFTIEQLVNGLRNGFEHPEPPEETLRSRRSTPPSRERARP